MNWNVIIPVVSCLLAAMRIIGFRHKAFQAVAHIWVGFLIGVYWCLKTAIQFQIDNRLVWWSIIGLSVVELACFLFLPKKVVADDV